MFVSTQPKYNHLAGVHNLKLLQNTNNHLLLKVKEHPFISRDRHKVVLLGQGKKEGGLYPLGPQGSQLSPLTWANLSFQYL